MNFLIAVNNFNGVPVYPLKLLLLTASIGSSFSSPSPTITSISFLTPDIVTEMVQVPSLIPSI